MNELDAFRNGRASDALAHPMYPREAGISFQPLDVLKAGPDKACFLATCDGGRNRCVLKACRTGMDTEYAFLTQNAEALRGLIPSPIAYWERDGVQYLMRQYIAGQTLEELYRNEAPLSKALLAKVADRLLAALERLHQAGLVHRDLKPENILWTLGGECVLIDMESARSPKPGQASDTVNLGTRSYASPEQLCDRQTDRRSDVYSVGRVLLYLCTGSDNEEAVKRLRGRVGRAVRRSVSFAPEKRYPTARAFRRALDGSAALARACVCAALCVALALGAALWPRNVVRVGDRPLADVLAALPRDEVTTVIMEGDQLLTQPVIIDGRGVVLAGNGVISSGFDYGSMFTVAPGASLTLRDGVTIESYMDNVLVYNHGTYTQDGGTLRLIGSADKRVALFHQEGLSELRRGDIILTLTFAPENNAWANCVHLLRGTVRLSGAHVLMENGVDTISAVDNVHGRLEVTGGSVFVNPAAGHYGTSITTHGNAETIITGGDLSPEPNTISE